ncbi:protein kinase domain-containing protein [Marinobacterium iners]|uniref:Protein kinase domain-containing protein n=1 Tax=Marinobacterium iners DSM 11526 TaxID=1122198 RepID=A0A1H3ZFS5_9GAMM|nr:lipopolysaccharide kinase InaA family protein [Marinobacterium iners]SEA22550.1 Protein kinase domain-containing protein [Marinobacterium iners DSM 11526]
MSEQAKQTSEQANSSVKKRLVHDQYGAEYECPELLGEGGQGKVWKTNHQNTLVKTFYRKDPDKEKRWFDHVQWVLRQDLEGLSIAAPKALIQKPVPGYVMELMDGLHPLSAEMEGSFTSLVGGEGLTGFLKTGGLKRRLLLLAELANTLARLHAKGLAYGDLSPNNIFVSERVKDARVWLIDCDNICTNERSGWEHLHTPGYGAPEVVRGESGVNSLTDAWSFAVIAYQLLTLQHPLVGVLVEDGEPELEEQAYRGELPWVCDPDDDCNEATGGIPMEMVASKRMQGLFHRCFEQGRLRAWDRPTLTEWRSVLDDATTMLLDCHNSDCRSSFLRNSSCPFCDTEADAANSVLLIALVYSSDPELERKLMQTGYGRVLNRGETASLKRVPAGTALFHESSEVCQVRLDDKGLAVKVVPGNRIRLVLDGKEQEITRGILLDYDKKQGRNYFLHLTPAQQSDEYATHPVWAFRW